MHFQKSQFHCLVKPFNTCQLFRIGKHQPLDAGFFERQNLRFAFVLQEKNGVEILSLYQKYRQIPSELSITRDVTYSQHILGTAGNLGVSFCFVQESQPFRAYFFFKDTLNIFNFIPKEFQEGQQSFYRNQR